MNVEYICNGDGNHKLMLLPIIHHDYVISCCIISLTRRFRYNNARCKDYVLQRAIISFGISYGTKSENSVPVYFMQKNTDYSTSN